MRRPSPTAVPPFRANSFSGAGESDNAPPGHKVPTHFALDNRKNISLIPHHGNAAEIDVGNEVKGCIIEYLLHFEPQSTDDFFGEWIITVGKDIQICVVVITSKGVIRPTKVYVKLKSLVGRKNIIPVIKFDDDARHADFAIDLLVLDKIRKIT